MRPFRPLLAALALSLSAASARAEAIDAKTGCDRLQTEFNRHMDAANTLVTNLANNLLKGSDTPQVMRKMGLSLGEKAVPDDAIRKGILAAMSPPAQNAIMIHLQYAETVTAQLAWKGCKPPGG